MLIGALCAKARFALEKQPCFAGNGGAKRLVLSLLPPERGEVCEEVFKLYLQQSHTHCAHSFGSMRFALHADAFSFVLLHFFSGCFSAA